ncbi:unnamed protein product [Gongylonema pulchrum]|uniref:Secreted protein n=1 Tax=Gongylonema pulchrum TaxID=637853 RepID=A0A183DND2_9BILA|nr:unnamed protein product [Gongylonema pulchrum]
MFAFAHWQHRIFFDDQRIALSAFAAAAVAAAQVKILSRKLEFIYLFLLLRLSLGNRCLDAEPADAVQAENGRKHGKAAGQSKKLLFPIQIIVSDEEFALKKTSEP